MKTGMLIFLIVLLFACSSHISLFEQAFLIGTEKIDGIDYYYILVKDCDGNKWMATYNINDSELYPEIHKLMKKIIKKQKYSNNLIMTRIK